MASRIRRAVNASAAAAERARLHVRHRLRRFGPLHIHPFHGYGTAREIHLNGRLLERDGVVTLEDGGGAWHAFRNTARRFLSDVIPDARMLARIGGATREFRTDADGYFHLVVAPDAPLEPGWHTAEFELLESVAGGEGLTASGEVLVPSEEAPFGVVSDIDDTVVYSAVTNRLRMLRIVLFQDARARIPFPGVAALYRALRRGPDGEGANPIFYVSKSPWNLYDLYEAFFRAHDIPRGPLFLRDIALFDAPSAALGLEQDKLSRIRKLLRLYPRLPFVLMGDSGQMDPEIYAQVVRENPGRIRAVYIRDVTHARRATEVRRIAAELREHDVPMLLERETIGAALHAVELGLIAREAVEEIRGEKRLDLAEGDDVLLA